MPDRHTLPMHPPRGILIVDTCALFDLTTNIAPTLKANGITPATYLDTLRFLGMSGYRVIIPEMISLEAGSICANGYDVNRLFRSQDSLPFAAQVKPLLQKAALPVGDSGKDCAGIEIMRMTGPAHVDDFCARINAVDVVRTKAQASRQRNGSSRIGTDYDGARSELQAIQSIYKKDFGDDAILSLLHQQHSFAPCENVTVVTADGGLLKRLEAQFPTVMGARPAQFVHGIASSAAGVIFGFTAGVQTDAITRDVYRGKNGGQGIVSVEEKQRMAASPLSASLQQLASELRSPRPAAPPDIEDNGGTPRFAERYSLPQRYAGPRSSR